MNLRCFGKAASVVVFVTSTILTIVRFSDGDSDGIAWSLLALNAVDDFRKFHNSP